jgi:hypothetical protein
MKASQVILERLVALGFEVLEQPRPNPWWRNAGYRSAGTCCWSVRVRKADIGEDDLLCWVTMREMAKAPVEQWDINHSRKPTGHADWWLDIKHEEKT